MSQLEFYRAGMTAFIEGRQLTDKPLGQPEFREAWRVGWCDARDQAEKAGNYLSALQEVMRCAEAGLCQFSAGGKHEFLKDIQKVCRQAGIEGILTDD